MIAWSVTLGGCLQIYGSRAVAPGGGPQVAPYQAAAANWNDWASAAQPTACTGRESGLDGCVHGGEARKFVTTYTSCAGLSLTDALGAFQWTCHLIDGKATFVSTLVIGKGLADLVGAVDGVPGWLPNSIALSSGGAVVATTQPAAWWSNPVVALTGGQALDTPGTIYVALDDISTSGYTINADRVAVVVKAGRVVRYGYHGYANVGVVSATNRRFIWIEGEFSGTDQASADVTGGSHSSEILALSNVSFSVVRNVFAHDPRGANDQPGRGAVAGIGVNGYGVKSSRFEAVEVRHVLGGDGLTTSASSGAAAYGIRLAGSAYNHLRAISASEIYAGASLTGYGSVPAYGIQLAASSDHNRLYHADVHDVFASAGTFTDATGYGVSIESSVANAVSGLSVYQIGQDSGGSDLSAGVGFAMTSTSQGSIKDLSSGRIGEGLTNGTPGVAVAVSGSSQDGFHGTLTVFGADQACAASGSDSLADGTCTTTGADGSGGVTADFPSGSVSDAVLSLTAPATFTTGWYHPINGGN